MHRRILLGALALPLAACLCAWLVPPAGHAHTLSHPFAVGPSTPGPASQPSRNGGVGPSGSSRSTNASDFPSLQAAVDATPPGGTLRLHDYRTTLQGPLRITRPIRIRCNSGSLITLGMPTVPGTGEISVQSSDVAFDSCFFDGQHHDARQFDGYINVGRRSGTTTPLSHFTFTNGAGVNLAGKLIFTDGVSEVEISNNYFGVDVNDSTGLSSAQDAFTLGSEQTAGAADASISGTLTSGIRVTGNVIMGGGFHIITFGSGKTRADIRRITVTGNYIETARGYGWNRTCATPSAIVLGDFAQSSPPIAGTEVWGDATVTENTIYLESTPEIPATTGCGDTSGIWDGITTGTMYDSTIAHNSITARGWINYDLMELFCHRCTIGHNTLTQDGTNPKVVGVHNYMQARITRNSIAGWGKNGAGILQYIQGPRHTNATFSGLSISDNTLKGGVAPADDNQSHGAIVLLCNLPGSAGYNSLISGNTILSAGSANARTPVYGVLFLSSTGGTQGGVCSWNGSKVTGNTVTMADGSKVGFAFQGGSETTIHLGPNLGSTGFITRPGYNKTGTNRVDTSAAAGPTDRTPSPPPTPR